MKKISICIILLAVSCSGKSKKSTPADCVSGYSTSHNLSGSTLTVHMNTNYSINAEYCAKDVMRTAYRIATDCFPNISRLKMDYGIEYENKYGEEKQVDLGTFEPDLTTLRRYKSGLDYPDGEKAALFKIYNVFVSNGFR